MRDPESGNNLHAVRAVLSQRLCLYLCSVEYINSLKSFLTVTDQIVVLLSQNSYVEAQCDYILRQDL